MVDEKAETLHETPKPDPRKGPTVQAFRALLADALISGR